MYLSTLSLICFIPPVAVLISNRIGYLSLVIYPFIVVSMFYVECDSLGCGIGPGLSLMMGVVLFLSVWVIKFIVSSIFEASKAEEKGRAEITDGPRLKDQ